MVKKNIFTVGGTVQAGSGLYIPRKADNELLELCQSGVFAYLLTSRQVGKSSLMVRTAEQLANEGTHTVIVDLTQLGVKVTAEAWYLGLLTTITDELMLDVSIVKWWEENADFGITQRLTKFFQEVVLAEVAEPIVIFIDEIDSTLSLDFTDDFFATIRYLYNARARVPVFQRLTFVLIGVATPGDLITDPHRTPFNIGQQVNLTDFTFDEASPLADGLDLPHHEAAQVLHWAMKWTGGHPYLTQRLCRTIAEQFRSDWSEAEVDRTVKTTFFGRMSEEDNNLQFVRDMLTKRAPDKIRVLSTYREIRTGRRPVRDEEQSPIKSHLKLSGIVKRENGKLQVRNPIYHQVFDRDWIKNHWPGNWLATVPMSVKITSGIIVFLLIVSISLTIAALNFAARERSAKMELEVAIDAKDLAIQKETAAKENETKALAEANLALIKADAARAEAQRFAAREMKARKEADFERIEKEKEADRADSIAFEEKTQRELADKQSLENKQLRLIETARRLTVQATLKKEPIDEERDVLIARQAYLFNKRNEGELKQEIYDALRVTLNTLNANSGGPIILSGHQYAVRSVTFHPDGKLIASASEDATVKIWEVNHPGEAIATYSDHKSTVKSIVFAQSGQLLVSAGDDNTICVRKLDEDSSTPKLLLGHTDWIETIAVDPQGFTLASSGRDKSIRLWDLQSIRIEPTNIIQYSAPIKAIAFNPNRKTLATAGNDKQVCIWALPQPGKQPAARYVDDNRIFSIAFSPDGKWLASGKYDGRISLWNLSQPNSNPIIEIAHDGAVNALAFSPDSRMLASGSSDKLVKLWELKSAGVEPGLEFQHPHFVWSVVFSPDGKSLATGCEDRKVRLWPVSADLLAEKVCNIVKRNLNQQEWNEFISSDIPHEPTCPNLPADNNAGKTTSPKSNR